MSMIHSYNYLAFSAINIFKIIILLVKCKLLQFQILGNLTAT